MAKGNGNLLPTSGRQWRKPREEGFLVQLPSGNVCRLRPLSPDLMLSMGEIPDLLTPLVEKMLFEGADIGEVTQALDKAIDPAEQFDAGNLLRLIRFIDAFCVRALIAPRIVENPQAEDEISIYDLGLQDRFAIYQYCIQPAEVLYSFHLVAQSALEPISDGGENGNAPIEHSGHPQSMGSLLP